MIGLEVIRLEMIGLEMIRLYMIEFEMIRLVYVRNNWIKNDCGFEMIINRFNNSS